MSYGLWTDTTTELFGDQTTDQWSATDFSESSTELQDSSLQLSAYYRDFVDLGSWLRAHDGLTLQDIRASLEAAGWTTSDLAAYLAAGAQFVEDLGAWLQAHDGLTFDDLGIALNAAGWTTQDLSLYLAALGQTYTTIEDAGFDLSAWGASLKDLQLSLAAHLQFLGDDAGVSFDALGEIRENLPVSFEAAADDIVDAVMFLRASNQELLSQLLYLSTVASSLDNAGLYLETKRRVLNSNLHGLHGDLARVAYRGVFAGEGLL